MSLLLGLGIGQHAEILAFMPDWVKGILFSVMAADGITAIIINLLLPEEPKVLQNKLLRFIFGSVLTNRWNRSGTSINGQNIKRIAIAIKLIECNKGKK